MTAFYMLLSKGTTLNDHLLRVVGPFIIIGSIPGVREAGRLDLVDLVPGLAFSWSHHMERLSIIGPIFP